MKPAIPFFGLLLLAAPLAAQSVMSGTVREDGSGKPLAGVEVLIEGSKRKTETDESGRYALEASSGNRVALFRFVGFNPVRLRVLIAKDDTTWANAQMVREAAQRLEPLEVAGEVKKPRGIGREGFEERRALGFGKFIDSTELRRSEHVRLADVLRRSSVEVLRMPDPRTAPQVRFIYVAASKQRRGCLMQVMLDGSPVYLPNSTSKPPIDLNTFDVASLESVEVYASGGRTPLEFSGAGAECGTVVLWTRR